MSVWSENIYATTFALIQLVPIIVPAEMDITFTKMRKLVWVRLLYSHLTFFSFSLALNVITNVLLKPFCR